MTGVLDVLLDLPFLPARRRIAELGLEQEVAEHRRKARVDLPLLPATDPIYGGAHVVVDAAPGNAAEHAEGVIMRVEQHLVCLLRVGAQKEGAAVAELEVGDLQLGALASNNRPVFRPIELESLAGHERQRHEYAAAWGLVLGVAGGVPVR